MNAFPTICLAAVVALASTPALVAEEEDAAGEKPRIVVPPKPERTSFMVRIADDGSWSDQEFRPLADEAALQAFLTSKKEEIEADGKEPQLVLRGEKKVLYDKGRDVIRMAFKAGVKRTIYSSIIRPSLMDAGDGIPNADEHVFVIAITADGRITMNGEAMDTGPDDRALKRMVQELQLAGKKHPEGAMGLKVWVLADNHAKHPRVIDVLNGLSEAKIRSIRFAGGEEKN